MEQEWEQVLEEEEEEEALEACLLEECPNSDQQETVHELQEVRVELSTSTCEY